jgi:ribonuclease HI
LLYDAGMSKIIIYTDGGARGNPGPAAVGVVMHDGDNKIELKKYLGDQLTNNFAEYEALILALHEAKKRGVQSRSVEVRMDSELVVKQLRGEYKVKDKTLKVKYADVLALLADFAHVTFVHVRREENKDADKLVNEALDEAA